MVPGLKPDGAVRSSRPRGGAPVKRSWPHGPVRSPPLAAHGRQEGGRGVSRARRGPAVDGAERDQAAAASAGGNAGGALAGGGAERFSGPVAGRRSGGGAGGSGWRRGLAPAAPPSPKRRTVCQGPLGSEEEGVLLPAVLEKVAAAPAKGGASAAYRYPHPPQASVGSARFLEINGAAPVDLASASALPTKKKRRFESVFVTKAKLKGKTPVYLEDDDILMAVAVHEGKLELCLGAPSRGRVWRHRPHGGGPIADRRARVRMMCRRFQFLCRFLAQAVKEGSVELSRVDLAADKVIKKLPDYIKYRSMEGEVDGVEVGDEFLYRVELAIVGLHNPFRAGIDTTKDTDGEPIAVSIVASGVYLDEYSRSGELIYIGSGGKAAGTDQDGDQKLERGNLALQNCIERKIPVRVTHGFKTPNTEQDSHCIGKEMPKFIYDGLYHVVGFWEEGIPGSRVFKYRLRRESGQPKLPLHVAKLLRESVVRAR